jgi:hypothetical protein
MPLLEKAMRNNMAEQSDYGESGLTVQYAMLDHAKRYPDKAQRPPYILWDGLRITTADKILVPADGRVRGEFLSCDQDVRQGFDLKIDGGWIELAGGERVPLLRTWKDERLADIIDYPFCSPDGLLWVWNVYEMTYPGGQSVEEKWTGNAGFWVEVKSESERIYHCSHGMAHPPDFEALVFKISVRPR